MLKSCRSPYALQKYVEAKEDGISRAPAEAAEKERAARKPRLEPAPPANYPFKEVSFIFAWEKTYQ